jgi:DMSO reductase family type II enzyme heme b subunit
MLTVQKSSAPDLSDPTAAIWLRAPAERVPLGPTPLGLQPTPYIQARYEGQPYGQTGPVEVRALTDGQTLYIHLSWADASEDDHPRGTQSFADGAALAFPIRGDAPIITMGSPDAPINAWLWRADQGSDAGRNVMAHGIGTSAATPPSTVRCRGVWKEGRWNVVFSRPLSIPDAAGGGVQFAPGDEVKFGVAIWNGSKGERAGIKSYSEAWHTLKVEG